MGDLLRFGLIGCGHQGRYLCEALTAAGGASLVACADPDPAARDRATAQFGFAHAYADGREMVATEDLDAVIVATVHDQLQPMALAAVEAGCHVFVEKPMALDYPHGRRLVDAAKSRGVKLMVGYALRYKPDRILMRELLSRGAIGEVIHAFAGQLIGRMGGWLAEREHGGGPLLYVGSHALDQVLWMVGRRPERVYAEINPAPESDVEADALLTIRFDGGCVAQVATSQRLGGRYGWLDLLGTGGRMRSEWESYRLAVESRTFPEYEHLTYIEVPPTAYLPAFRPDAVMTLPSWYYLRMWAAEMVEFTAAIREDREPAMSGEDGLRCLAVMDAAHESARTGRAVEVRIP